MSLGNSALTERDLRWRRGCCSLAGGTRGRTLLGPGIPGAESTGADRFPTKVSDTTRLSGGRPTDHPIGTQPHCAEASGSVRAARREPCSARLRPRDRRQLRHRRLRWLQREPERRSSSESRALTTNGCGPTSFHLRQCASTRSATWPPTSLSPTGPSTPGGPTPPGTVCEVRFEHSPGRLDPAYIGNLCAFQVPACAEPWRRDAGDRRSSRPSTTSVTGRSHPSRAGLRDTWRSPRGRAPSSPERSTR